MDIIPTIHTKSDKVKAVFLKWYNQQEILTRVWIGKGIRIGELTFKHNHNADSTRKGAGLP